MPDKTMDSLKQASMKENKNKADDCPMAEQISAYAFGELGPEQSRKIKEHLASCRYCLDMYLDIRVAQEEADSLIGQKPHVLPGLQEAIDKGKKPSVSILQKIRDAVTDFLSLKPVAVFATMAFLCVGIYVLWDNLGPHTSTPYSIEILMQGRTQTGLRGGQPIYDEFQVQPGGVMKSKDYFRFQTRIDKDAHVYIIFQDSTGQIQATEKGFIFGGKAFLVPKGDKWFQLDQTTGTEKICLIASEDEIKEFKQKINELKKEGMDNINTIFPKSTIQTFSFQHQ